MTDDTQVCIDPAMGAVNAGPGPHHRGELCPYGHLAYRWLDEADFARAAHAREKAARERAEARLRALTGPRSRRSNRATVRGEVRTIERTTQHLHDLAEDGGATPDQLVAVAQVVGRLEDHAEAWRRASALSWRAADNLGDDSRSDTDTEVTP